MAKKTESGPARATRLNRQVSMELATESTAKQAAEQAASKANLRAMKKPTTPAEKLQLAVALVHARDGSAFKKHTETRADLPTRGIDQVTLPRQ